MRISLRGFDRKFNGTQKYTYRVHYANNVKAVHFDQEGAVIDSRGLRLGPWLSIQTRISS